ncbi:MAG: hypothetical protein OZ921_16230 [Sorangiineae bacterium]|nr:hypothetical protein [Polyangiaceae bacterium]MEB2324061.1 hypothetical protein [Sorangiineae bacterium]
MSESRKLRRAQRARRERAETPEPIKDRDALRRELASERFKRPGSEALWSALLGWELARLERIWLCQAVHDAARRQDAALVRRELLARAPAVAERLASDESARAVELCGSSGDEYRAGNPSPKWHYLASVAARLGLGEPTPDELQDDWEVWTSMALAAPVRKALLDALAEAEKLAGVLAKGARSERAGAVANVTRAVWSALAYGEEPALARVEGWSAEWLAALARADVHSK